MMILALAGVTAAGATWWLTGRGGRERDLVLYGNVDLRQVELAFNNSERIAAVLVQKETACSVAKSWHAWMAAVWSRRSQRPRQEPRHSIRR
jgi:hypothetical protein